MFAQHSIRYENLETYLYGISIWDELNNCLSWDDTILWFKLLNIHNLPILYDGIYDETKIKKLYNEKLWTSMEGYVIRIADKFSYMDFSKSMAKFVRKGHVMTTKHNWQTQQVIPNGIIK